MFDPSTILKSLPSIWRTKFQDRDLLSLVYSFLGTYISDCYRGAVEELSSQSLEYTPLTRSKVWKCIELNSSSRFYVRANDSQHPSYAIYGLLEIDEVLDSCSRLYNIPSVEGAYLEITKDYILARSDSNIIKAIEARTSQTNFFQRFDRYIIFIGSDPFLGIGQIDPANDSIYYPLIFKVNKDSLTVLEQQDLAEGNVLSITHLGITFPATISDVEEIDSGSSYAIILDIDSFGNIANNDVLSIEGLAATPLKCSVLGGYALPRDLVKVWAFDCEVDQFQLQYKFGHLLGFSDGFQKSTKQYKNLLRLILEARLRTVSTDLLRRLGDVLSGSEIIEYQEEYEGLRTLNIVTNRLTTSVTEYSLIPKAPINYKVINNINTLVTDFGPISSSDLVEVVIGEGHIFDLISQGLQESRVLTFVSFEEGSPGAILCSTDRFSLIVYANISDLTVPASAKVVYGVQSYEFINLDVTTMAISRLDNKVAVGIGEPINPSVYITDVNSSGDWWQDVGLTIPPNVWDTDYSPRREISSGLWNTVVGQMPHHRVGDYLFHIDETNQTTQETSYLLFRDFLQNKVAVLNTYTYATNSTTYNNLTQLRNVSHRLINLSKVILPIQKLGFVEFIPAASESLSISVGQHLIEDPIPMALNTGIGSINPTVVVELETELTYSNINISLTISGINTGAVILGYKNPYLLLELQTVPTNAELDSYVNISGVFGKVVYTTNFVGADSIFTVVGASYPEYTQYYGFTDDYTTRQSLAITTEAGVSEGSMTDNIDSPTDSPIDIEVT